jgi:hypothetical protein
LVSGIYLTNDILVSLSEAVRFWQPFFHIFNNKLVIGTVQANDTLNHDSSIELLAIIIVSLKGKLLVTNLYLSTYIIVNNYTIKC